MGWDGWDAQPLLMLPQTRTFVSMSREGMLQLAAQYILQHGAIISSHSRCQMGCRERSTVLLPALFKCRHCCQASLVHLSSPNLRCWILGSCKVFVGGGEINAQSGVLPRACFIQPIAWGERVLLAVVLAGRVSWQQGAHLPDETAWRGCGKPCCLQWHC